MRNIYQIYCDSDDNWTFLLIASENGKVLAKGGSFKSKEEALETVDRIKDGMKQNIVQVTS